MSLIGSGDSGNPATGQGGTGNPPGNPPAGGSGNPPGFNPNTPTPTWRDSLPEDIRANPALQSFSDVGNLAKSYLHAQQQIGKKGVILPGEKATDDDWTQFHRQIGVPEKIDDYGFKVPTEGVNKELVGKFREQAHKMGLLPKQAEGLLNWQMGYEKEAGAARAAEMKKASEESINGLKKEWGEGWEKNVKAANAAVMKLGGEEFAKYLSKTGLGNDVQVIKFINKVALAMGEDKLVGDGHGKMGQTPAEVRQKIDSIMGTPNHPYFDSTHPGHKAAVAEMEGMYRSIAG